MNLEPTRARYSAAVRLRVGAGIGHEQAVEARDAVPVW